jgi:hypothetical protein
MKDVKRSDIPKVISANSISVICVGLFIGYSPLVDGFNLNQEPKLFLQCDKTF